MTRPVIENRRARRLFLARHGLGRDVPKDLGSIINQLGFVQVDSINTVARAHDMILSARSRTYRPKHLKRLLEKERHLFEHWTHDAAVIPVEFFPYWRLRFQRDRTRLLSRWKSWRRDGFAEKFETVLTRVRDGGACRAREVGTEEPKNSGGWWDWHPSKTALEFLWRTGELAVCRRDGFQKVYDLSERVIPAEFAADHPDARETIDWACNAALDRLGFATSGEIAAFWDLVTPDETKAWCRQQTSLIEVDIMCADGKARAVYCHPALLEEAEPDLPGGIRVLSPFDPALRDRKRAERLFGFHYRIEIFVPEAKRKHGYYVFPLLEGDRLIGRIDMKRVSDSGVLHVRALWPEAGVKMGEGRRGRLEAELHRVARFAGCNCVTLEDGWIRPSEA